MFGTTLHILNKKLLVSYGLESNQNSVVNPSMLYFWHYVKTVLADICYQMPFIQLISHVNRSFKSKPLVLIIMHSECGII